MTDEQTSHTGVCAHDRAGANGPHQHGYVSDKAAVLKRLRRVEGQVRGIERLVDDERYCIDVITQISAATSALENIALLLLEDHLTHCVTGAAHTAAESGDSSEIDAKIAEATRAITRLVKS